LSVPGLVRSGTVARPTGCRDDAFTRRTARPSLNHRWTQEPREVVAEAGLSVRDNSTGLLGIVTTSEVDPA
jgi:hypothetical protein